MDHSLKGVVDPDLRQNPDPKSNYLFRSKEKLRFEFMF
jgi:hypothetical protein